MNSKVLEIFTQSYTRHMQPKFQKSATEKLGIKRSTQSTYFLLFKLDSNLGTFRAKPLNKSSLL
jgi:hypothetical protein